jgi:dolichol-phosphate mannosyltransferase
MSHPVFSLVVPVLNEEEVLHDTRASLATILNSLDIPYEVLVVDNGSTDRTPELMAEFCRADRRWKYLRLSRNFGYQNSITAGMLAASGDAIMIIDADLQDPPEMIPQFLERWREGYDVVYGVREKRIGESACRIGLTMFAMRLIHWLSDEVKLPAHSGDFRLISRRVRDAFAELEETNRYVRGMINWLGFRQIGIPYTRRGRVGGASKVNWPYLIDFTINAIVNFSFKPFRLYSVVGLAALALTGLLGAVYLLAPNSGLTAAHLLLLANLGFLSTGIGVLGEYVGRIHLESKRRPLWLVDYTLNLDGQEPSRRSVA